jgi:hypothetical protein
MRDVRPSAHELGLDACIVNDAPTAISPCGALPSSADI